MEFTCKLAFDRQVRRPINVSAKGNKGATPVEVGEQTAGERAGGVSA